MTFKFTMLKNGIHNNEYNDLLALEGWVHDCTVYSKFVVQYARYSVNVAELVIPQPFYCALNQPGAELWHFGGSLRGGWKEG